MKEKKIKWKILLFLALVSSGIYAQNNTTSSGGNGTGSGGSISYSVGQVSYTRATGSGGNASAGVQQPFEIFTLGNDDFTNIKLSVTVFPNPTTTSVTLKISDYNLENLNYIVFDFRGRLLENKKINLNETQIQMDRYVMGTYLINILDKNKIIKTFKIIKN